MTIDSSRERIRHISPKPLQQFLAWNRYSRSFDEVAEKLKLASRNIDWLSSSRNGGSLRVDNDRAKFVGTLARRYEHAPQLNFDACDKFSVLKRHGYVIVRAKP